METPALPPVGCTQRRVAVLTTVHGDDGDDADDRGTRRAVLAMPCSLGVPWEWGFLLRNPRAAQPWHAAGLRAVHLVPLTLASASAQNFRGFSEKTPRLMVAVCRASLGGRSFPSLCTCPRCLLTVLAFLPILQRSRGARPPAPAPAPGPGPGPSVAWILAGIRGDGGGADVFCPQAS